MSNKDIQKKRMLMYFIEATQSIMEKDGIENVTIRKIADVAGYNSATLYNYFKNLDHLISFASIKYLKAYNLDIAKCENKYTEDYKKYYEMWRIFCKHSFKNAPAFFLIFFNLKSKELKEMTKLYYEIFPEDLGVHNSDITLMLTGENINTRNKMLLNHLVKSNYIELKDVEIINDIVISFYKNLLLLKVDCMEQIDSEELTKKMLTCIEFIITRK
ncbi:MAG: TetR/AcrR family transcriptional regulator [Clostridioides difficile]|nr:TetR/AcrR family transcriptional regulator [Clostridioides difficile]